jgi:tetratricopeptide (TPR) repeat protein
MRSRFALPGILVLGLLGLPATVFSALDAGTESTLDLGADARTMAMGRTSVTDYSTPLAADWNPASLGYLPQLSLALQQAVLFDGAVHQTVGVAYPTLDWGTLALTAMRLQISGIERRDDANLANGEFSMVEQQLTLAYAYPVFDFLSLGATVKVHDLKMDVWQATAPGMDAGLLFKLPLASKENPGMFQEVSAGLAVQNAVSPMLKLDQVADRMNPSWKLGGSVAMNLLSQVPDRLLISAEMEKPEQAGARWHAGAEYQLVQIFSLRGGWDNEYFAAGAGLQYAGVRLDYAVSFPAIGMRHLVTLSMALGSDMNVMRTQRAAEEERKRLEIVDNLKNGIVNDYRRQAKAMMEKGDYPAAAKFWEKVLDWEPANSEAKTGLETAQRETQQRENAESLRLAKEYLRDQKYIDVMVECRNVLDRDPKNGVAQDLYRQAEDKATRMGNTALSMNMKTLENIRREYQLGLKAYTERNWEVAIEHWEKVIETSPLQKQVYSYLQTARSRMVKTKEEAVKVIEVKQTESKHEKLYKEAVDLSRSGKLKEAVRTWETLSKDNPQDQDTQKNLDKTRQDLIDSQKKGIRW